MDVDIFAGYSRQSCTSIMVNMTESVCAIEKIALLQVENPLKTGEPIMKACCQDGMVEQAAWSSRRMILIFVQQTR